MDKTKVPSRPPINLDVLLGNIEGDVEEIVASQLRSKPASSRLSPGSAASKAEPSAFLTNLSIPSTPSATINNLVEDDEEEAFSIINDIKSQVSTSQKLFNPIQNSSREKINDKSSQEELSSDFYQCKPKDFNISVEESKKYFGPSSRDQFFQQYHNLHRQKAIMGTSINQPTPSFLSVALTSINAANNLPRVGQVDVESVVSSSVKVSSSVNINTRIIIRTQSLLAEDTYDQIKIVQRPANMDLKSILEDVDSKRQLNSMTPPEKTASKSEPIGKFSSDLNMLGRPKGLNHSLLPPKDKSKISVEALPLSQIKLRSDQSPQLSPLSDCSTPKRGKSTSNKQEKFQSPPKTAKVMKKSKNSNDVNFSKVNAAGFDDGNDISSKKTTSSNDKHIEKNYEEQVVFPPLISPPAQSTPSLSKQPISPRLEFLCIDHRDAFNKKVIKQLQKKNSLFEYVESKHLKKDFYDFDGNDSNAVEFDDDLAQLQALDKLTKLNSKSLPNLSLHHVNQNNTTSSDLSPRSQFIDNCIRQRLNPRASLILRKSFTKELNLKHLGMGDKMAILLAEAIVNVPYIHSLNIRDNNLNDNGLSAIVNSIRNMKDLVELDMSFNVIGPRAAESLAEYLSAPSCPLVRLVLEKADVDDDECQNFVLALHQNRCLQEIDLSDNKIGNSENLNTVLPDITTGGEALAELLESETCPLKSLKLGWNMIRLDGAITLCQSLSTNKSLTYLELSYNSLSSSGGIALGNALQDNTTLKTLLIANNSIDSIGCMTICAGILQNEALEYVSFEGNPVGEQGAKVLMLLPTIIGSRVKISTRNCNFSIRDANNWFDTTALIRKFELDLSNPYDRAVAIILTYIIPSHQTYIVAFGEYYDSEKKKSFEMKFKEVVDKEYYQKKSLEPEQLRAINGLHKILDATKDRNKALEMFRQADEDGSGELDEEEFGKLMLDLGMDATEEKVREVLAEYDVDGGGVIEISEFLLFLKNEQKEAKKRLQELTEMPVLISANEELYPNIGSVVKYLPPRFGTLKMSIIDGFTQKETFRVISPGDRSNILSAAQQSGDMMTMTSFGVKNYKIRISEAYGIVESLLKESSNKVAVLCTVLPQMSLANEARQLVSKVLQGNLNDISRLKREIGQSYRVIMGSPDGYYSLDLSNEMDRFCVNRLLEISMTTAHFRSLRRDTLGYGRLGDTSQKNNFTAFRNELLNRKVVILNSEFASPLPRTGKLEFDFVSQKRYQPDQFVLNDVRFTNLLVKTFQLHHTERLTALKSLTKVRKLCDKTLTGDGVTIYETPKEKALEIGYQMFLFHDHLHERYEQLDKFREKESVKVMWEYDPRVVQMYKQTIHKVYTIQLLFERHPHYHPDYRPVSEASAAISKKRNQNKSSMSTKTEKSQKMDVSAKHDDQSSEHIHDELNLTEDMIPEEGEMYDYEEDLDNSETESVHNGDEDEEDAEDSVGSLGKNSDKNGPTFESAVWELIEETSKRNTDIPEKNSNERRSSMSVSSDSKSVTGSAVVNTGADGIATFDANASLPQEIGVNAVNDTNSLASSVTQGTASSKKKKREPLPEMLNRYMCLMASKNIQVQTKAAKTLEILFDTFDTLFLLSRHMEMLVLLFHDLGTLPTSNNFGTYRVELVVGLFSNIVDLHNFEIVLRHLSSYEVACIYCRIGILNIFNPMKPEGSLQLDMSRYDERMVVKMLAQLSVIEPGDNLPFVQFRWEREMDCMPGYELTELWLTEDGLPKKGLWDVTYYSGEGKGLKDCKPVVKFRKSLLQLVLIDEQELMTDADRDAEKTIQPVGPAFINSNPGIWHGYLAYNEEQYKAYKDKRGISSDNNSTGSKRK